MQRRRCFMNTRTMTIVEQLQGAGIIQSLEQLSLPACAATLCQMHCLTQSIISQSHPRRKQIEPCRTSSPPWDRLYNSNTTRQPLVSTRLALNPRSNVCRNRFMRTRSERVWVNDNECQRGFGGELFVLRIQSDRVIRSARGGGRVGKMSRVRTCGGLDPNYTGVSNVRVRRQ